MRRPLALLFVLLADGACIALRTQRSKVRANLEPGGTRQLSASSLIASRRKFKSLAAYPWEKIPNTARHVIASATSGAIAVTLLAPLEVIRLNVLANPDASLASAFASLKGSSFRGNTADVIAGAARIGIIMPAFSFYKDASRRVASSLDPTREDNAPVPRWGVFLAGALAGCTATTILFPLEVARTRMAMECSIDSVYSCLETIWNAEGLRAIYRGLTTSLSGVMPFNAIKLSSYDLLRQQATTLVGGGDTALQLPAFLTAAVGALAGVTAATSCFPIEVIRRRQMMGEFGGLGVRQAMFSLAQSEGVGVLYRGVFVNMAKVALSNALGFVLYEVAKDCLQVDGRTPPWDRAAGGRSQAAAKIL